jgi:hypothetical protein
LTDHEEIVKNSFVRKFIDLAGLKSGCGNKFDFAAYFELTEEFNALPCYIQNSALLDLLISLFQSKKES